MVRTRRSTEIGCLAWVAIGASGGLAYGAGDLRRGRLQLALSLADDIAVGDEPAAPLAMQLKSTHVTFTVGDRQRS